MPFAISAVAHRFNADVLADLPVLQQPKFPPPPPPPPEHQEHIVQADLKSLDFDWCGTVPRKFPIPVPPKGGLEILDDWCGTKPRPFPGPIPPTPQPWLDLANAAQSFR